MTRTPLSLLTLLLSFVTVLTCCNPGELNKKADETAVKFYNNLQKKDFDAALTMCSEKAFKGVTREEWRRALLKNAVLLGDLKSFHKSSGFNIEASTETGTTIKTAYTAEWQFGKSEDSVFFTKEKDGDMKIYRYSWKHSDAKYLSAIMESEKQAERYMEAIKTKDYGTAVNFCSDEALVITPREKWVGFLQNADGKLGNVATYHVIGDSSSYNIDGNGQAGKGNYYDIFIQTSRAGGNVMEKIVFFQKNYNEPLKLAGHFFL